MQSQQLQILVKNLYLFQLRFDCCSKMQLHLRLATHIKMQLQLRQATHQYILIQLRLATKSEKQIPIVFLMQMQNFIRFAFCYKQKDFHFNLSCNSGIYSFKNDFNFHCNPDAQLCCITSRVQAFVAAKRTEYFLLR